MRGKLFSTLIYLSLAKSTARADLSSPSPLPPCCLSAAIATATPLQPYCNPTATLLQHYCNTRIIPPLLPSSTWAKTRTLGNTSKMVQNSTTLHRFGYNEHVAKTTFSGGNRIF